MLNELVPYLFAGSDNAEDAPMPVRIVMRSEVPWFVAVDICRVLGLTNSRKALTNLDEEEKGVTISDTLGGIECQLREARRELLRIRDRFPDREPLEPDDIAVLRKLGFEPVEARA